MLSTIASVLVLLLATLAFATFRLLQARLNRRAVLQRVLARVSGRLRAGPSRLGLDDEVEGEHLERRFRLRLGTRLTLRGERYPLVASLELAHAPAVRLRIRREEGLAAVEKALGLVRDVEVSGGAGFDRRHLIESDGEHALVPLAEPAVRDAVQALLYRWDLDELTIGDGWLQVGGDSRCAVGARLIHDLLDALEVLAHAYDRRPVVEVAPRDRFLWTGGSDGAGRCPYCHDALELERAVGLVACSGCETLLHAECHVENGGCPILGCGGRGALPAGPIPL